MCFLEFSTSLIRYQLDFLRNIDARGELFYDEKFIRNAIRRYEYVWIPLVQKLTSDDPTISDLDLAPPLGTISIYYYANSPNKI